MSTADNEQYRAGFEAWFEAEYPKDEEGNRRKYRDTMVMDLMRSAWEGGKREASTEPSAALDGWTFQRDGDWIVVEHPSVGRTALSRHERRVSNEILYHLLESLERLVAGALPDEATDWRERAAQACYAQRETKADLKMPEDVAYNQAIENCMDAIRNLKGGPDEAKDAAHGRTNSIDRIAQQATDRILRTYGHSKPALRNAIRAEIVAAIEAQAKAGKAHG